MSAGLNDVFFFSRWIRGKSSGSGCFRSRSSDFTEFLVNGFAAYVFRASPEKPRPDPPPPPPAHETIPLSAEARSPRQTG